MGLRTEPQGMKRYQQEERKDGVRKAVMKLVGVFITRSLPPLFGVPWDVEGGGRPLITLGELFAEEIWDESVIFNYSVNIMCIVSDRENNGNTNNDSLMFFDKKLAGTIIQQVK